MIISLNFFLLMMSLKAVAAPLITILPIDLAYKSTITLGSSLTVSYLLINNTPVTLTNVSASDLLTGIISSTCQIIPSGGSCALDLTIPASLTQYPGTIENQFQVCVVNSETGCTLVDSDKAINITIADNHTLLAISDIHLKSGNTQSINYGEDTGEQLWESTKIELSALINQFGPKFILLLGDVAAHNFSEHTNDIAASLTGISGLNAISNKSLPVFYVFGNNDSLVSDYGAFYDGTHNLFFLDPGHNSPVLGGWPSLNANPDCSISPLQACTYTITAPMPIAHITDMANAQTFCYYSAYPLGRSIPLRLIVLNSVIFSRLYRGPSQRAVSQDEMDWFAAQLASAYANGEAVYIAMHIPVGNNPFDQNRDLWNSSLILNNGLTLRDTFLALIAQYKTIIRSVISGHIHTDEVRALYADTSLHDLSSLDDGVPSISPIFGNNPGMQVFLFDISFNFTDIKTFYNTPTPALTWYNYSFQNDFACPIASTIFSCVNSKILTQLFVWKTLPQPIPNNPYEKNYSVKNPTFDPVLGGFNWLDILNTIQVIP